MLKCSDPNQRTHTSYLLGLCLVDQNALAQASTNNAVALIYETLSPQLSNEGLLRCDNIIAKL